MRALAVAVVVIAALGSAKAAKGGTYVVEACRTTNGQAPTGAWRAEPIAAGPALSDPLVEDACAHGGVRFLAAPLIAGKAFGMRWVFDAPPGTSVAALRLQRYATLPGDHRADYGVLVGAQMLERSPQRGPWTFGTPDVADELRADGLAGPDVAVAFGCFPETPGCPGAGWKVVIARAAVTLRDDAAPRVVGAPSGSLLADGKLDGIVDLRLGYADSGGGVDTVELLVDGKTHSVQWVGGAACVPPYVTAVPCSLDGDAAISLDTTQLSGGAHQAELRLTDVAGNRTVVGPYPISVHSRQPPQSAPVPESERPAASDHVPGTLSVTGKRSRRIEFASHKLTGLVRGLYGEALAGARVELTSRPLRGGSWASPTTVTSGGDGRFSVVLPRGPSREIRVAYGSSTQTVKLIVAAPVRLATDRKATRNGRTVQFSGTVPGTGQARARVELQAWTGRWVPFKSAALKHGRFKASYRFTSTYATTRYRFRAVVHESGDFPYASGKSPVVSVLVKP